jgi:predicted outer membrane lipoprotein
VLLAAAFGIVVVSALWWLYFDVAATSPEGGSCRRAGVEQARLA